MKDIELGNLIIFMFSYQWRIPDVLFSRKKIMNSYLSSLYNVPCCSATFSSLLISSYTPITCNLETSHFGTSVCWQNVSLISRSYVGGGALQGAMHNVLCIIPLLLSRGNLPPYILCVKYNREFKKLFSISILRSRLNFSGIILILNCLLWSFWL
jgi:hypothetical protein